MRPDFAKILVERPRRGGTNDRKGRAVPIDDLPQKESMRKPHRDRKELNENLSPLYRFLEKSVGRKWDDVYSEITENLNPNNAVQYHILQHLKWYVDEKTKPYGPTWFYVDDSGILRAVPKRKYKRKPEVYEDLIGREAVRVNGVWYKIETHTPIFTQRLRYPPTAECEIMRIAKVPSYWHGYTETELEKFWGRKGISGCKGKQLSKKEIRDALRLQSHVHNHKPRGPARRIRTRPET